MDRGKTAVGVMAVGASMLAGCAAIGLYSFHGEAVLRCTVEEGWRSNDCVVVSETPAGANVGATALQIIDRIGLAGTPGSVPVGEKVTFTVRVRAE